MNSTTQMLKELLHLLVINKPLTEHIRVGGAHDGGYIIPNDTHKITSVISAGINDDVCFDNYFAEKGIPIFQFDPSIKSPPDSPFSNFFHFSSIAIGDYEESIGISVSDIIDSPNLEFNSGEILYKFDIEGGEYSSFNNSTDESLNKIRVMTGEFHEINNVYKLPLILSTFKKLKHLFFISHIHVNSNSSVILVDGIPMPSLLEITFLNRNFYNHLPEIDLRATTPLDKENLPGQSEILWNPAWYLL